MDFVSTGLLTLWNKFNAEYRLNDGYKVHLFLGLKDTTLATAICMAHEKDNSMVYASKQNAQSAQSSVRSNRVKTIKQQSFHCVLVFANNVQTIGHVVSKSKFIIKHIYRYITFHVLTTVFSFDLCEWYHKCIWTVSASRCWNCENKLLIWIASKVIFIVLLKPLLTPSTTMLSVKENFPEKQHFTSLWHFYWLNLFSPFSVDRLVVYPFPLFVTSRPFVCLRYKFA